MYKPANMNYHHSQTPRRTWQDFSLFFSSPIIIIVTFHFTPESDVVVTIGKETPKNKWYFTLFSEPYIKKFHNKTWFKLFNKKYMHVHQFIILLCNHKHTIYYCTFCKLLLRTGMHLKRQHPCAYGYLYHL